MYIEMHQLICGSLEFAYHLQTYLIPKFTLESQGGPGYASSDSFCNTVS